jgi:hypothetical protein
MPFVSRENLKLMLYNHCVEIKYQRRHPLVDSNTCRLFCVGFYPNFDNNPFLNSIGARSAFYKPSKGSGQLKYNPDQKNLVITYSIFDQAYRTININRANVIRRFPVDNKENIKKFWEYFNSKIATMSIEERTAFKKK